jgi:acyl carrier protein
MNFAEHKHAQTIRHIIAEVLEVDPQHIQGSTNFVTDLGADSMRIIEILSRIEATLKIFIDQSQLARMVSFESVCEVIDDAKPVAA